MRKILLTTLALMIFSISVYADDNKEALDTFYNYVEAANTYSATVFDYYSPTAKIIRQVIKPDGKTVDVLTDTATYIKQMKIGQAGAKMRSYKNIYTNVTVIPISAGKIKITSVRHPSVDNDSLKAYMVFERQPNGKWIITEEMMQTRQQIFLKYAK